MRVNPIRHQIELAIRWNKRDQSLGIEFVQAHALVEFDILQLNKLIPGLLACHLEKRLIVEAQFEFGHAAQRRPHFYCTKYLGP